MSVRLARIPALLLVTLLLWVSLAPPAQADDDDTPKSWMITRYDVAADAARDGAIRVTTDLDFDFADDEGHGPYVTLPTRQRIEGDPDHWRSFEITDITAASASGAPADVETDTDGGVLSIRVGDEDQEVTGVQSYRIGYTISGVVNPDVAASNLDEINWSIIGAQWQVPINDVSVTLTGPAPAERVACFVGEDLASPCSQAPVPGNPATYAVDALDREEPLQIVAGYPVGTFVGAEPTLTKRYHPGNVIPLTPLSGTLGGALLLGGVAGLIVAARRVGRDRQYVAAAYGYAPGDGAGSDDAGRKMAANRPATRQPVAVQFSPPKQARPGELGTLTDETADTEDITATIVDLAVRGFLRIEEIPSAELTEKEQKSKADAPERYRLVKLAPPGELVDYEQAIYDPLFADGDSPTMAELGTGGRLLKAGVEGKKALHKRVAADLNWFRIDPSRARGIWLGVGAGITVVGIALTLALGFGLGLGVVGIAIFLVGLATMATTSVAASRTPDGVAMLQQALGFKLYLTTAEAEQLRFEEGEDIFSRYLPYAIAWGCAERWAEIFQHLADRGVELAEPTWLVGAHPFLWASGSTSMLEGISGFTAASASVMTASTAGTTGASGFAGGGGVAGGGGGGW